MNKGNLSSQITGVIEKLNFVYEEIGIPCHERETRESEMFATLSHILNDYVRKATIEKNDLMEEAKIIIKTIKQMEDSLEDKKSHTDHKDDDVKITYPLKQCLKDLKRKHLQTSKLHKERFEEIKELVQALKSYSSHLEPTFLQISLPPTSPNASIPPTFDLSPTYFASLEKEFDRVYKEYNQRISTVKALSESIIHLWAELGTKQAETDVKIVEHYKESPEQLGLHQNDITQLTIKRDKLMDLKKEREKQLRELSETIESLWNKLGIDDDHKRSFFIKNRGLGIRQINEFENELHQLNELKRQNLHLFVEDARCKLQELWDSLYFSEEEMLEFTPAFSDVYTDALLEAHDQEISRLQKMKDQRAPILALLEKHRALVKDRDDLQASSQDVSRLLGRGQKGEKRDPTRLLREEKMRKRISKDLPKVSIELKKELERWENDHSQPFLVHGDRYLDVLLEDSKQATGPRSKTPSNLSIPAAKVQNGVASTRENNTKKVPSRAPSRAGPKTPATNISIKRNAMVSTIRKSPSKIPARAPLSNLNNENSLERKFKSSLTQDHVRAKMSPIFQAPPPKMRNMNTLLPSMSISSYRAESVISSGSLRQVTPEDMFHDETDTGESQQINMPYNYKLQGSKCLNELLNPKDFHSNRQISSNSNTTMSGSENWQTIEDDSDPENEEAEDYYASLRANNGKRFISDDYYPKNQSTKPRAIISSPTA
ncbi:Anaphase spindle elongation protein 1 [Golovinomyces cichoracearum]|uniref:Anaphase spindle elongation protein 1 n=1 Tax=Golovinomyces cichoracearum TaxID=62708 RepID=A0A420IGI3_9PEZI|nr:Anaphase spindle elongation protein 1 [Golovinomyces cichoracearum]